jgi:hypothetical protein
LKKRKYSYFTSTFHNIFTLPKPQKIYYCCHLQGVWGAESFGDDILTGLSLPLSTEFLARETFHPNYKYHNNKVIISYLPIHTSIFTGLVSKIAQNEYWWAQIILSVLGHRCPWASCNHDHRSPT